MWWWARASKLISESHQVLFSFILSNQQPLSLLSNASSKKKKKKGEKIPKKFMETTPNKLFFTCNNCTKPQCFGSNLEDFYVLFHWGVAGFSLLSNGFVFKCIVSSNMNSAQVMGPQAFLQIMPEQPIWFVHNHLTRLYQVVFNAGMKPLATWGIWGRRKTNSKDLFPLSNLQEITKWWATIHRFHSGAFPLCGSLMFSTLCIYYLAHASLVLFFFSLVFLKIYASVWGRRDWWINCISLISMMDVRPSPKKLDGSTHK